ncbi:MAG: iron ABC transporter substrate-binding protein [Actinomycetales bacterium]|nr:MAG: iron ABC transporter substrate-binding protein [Actinomycetales bacterium]
MSLRHARFVPALASFALVLSACAGAPDADDRASADTTGYPVKAASCGFTSTVKAKPERVLTMNQGATEVVLALGLEKQLAGTAYLDDAVPEKWKAAYDSVDVLSKEYPDHESVLAAEPDFVYASYISAFDEEVAGSPAGLAKVGIGSYTSPLGCGDDKLRDVSFDTVWDEIDTVAEVLGAPGKAEKIRAEQKALLADLADEKVGDGLDVFWFDSGDKTALAGAGEGGPQLVLDAVGATNLFSSLKGGWADVSWEKVVDADPEVIVLADASWSSAADKIAFLQKDPALSKLEAVREKRFVVLPYSESTPGVRLADGAQRVADGITALDLG